MTRNTFYSLIYSNEIRDSEPVFTEREAEAIFDAKMRDLGLDVKLHAE
jgi:hypothetical protein